MAAPKTIPSVRIAALLVVVMGLLVFHKEAGRERPTVPLKEACLFCHERTTDPDAAHRISGFGCASCHLGNPFAYEKARAHTGLVKRPGDLRSVEKTCGAPGCHPEAVTRVKNGLMATNAGILKVLQRRWEDLDRRGREKGASVEKGPGRGEVRPVATVRDLLGREPPRDLPLDLYAKMCGACHLWKPRGDRPGEIGERGGGCSDCHLVPGPPPRTPAEGPLDHPRLTTRIPSENCIKCHNRSARMGLSYFGRYESEGYGTPYEKGDFSPRTLSGNRHYLDITPDVHQRKAGMDCIDCHTSMDLMGDGKAYDRMEEQVDVACTDCHRPTFDPPGGPLDPLAERLTRANGMLPEVGDNRIARTRKGTSLYNLRLEKGGVLFYRKRDGRPFPLQTGVLERPHHRFPGHGRLSCQACHSPWVPQCYGCHLTTLGSEMQHDWLAGRHTQGRWKEARAFMRFLTPGLGVRQGGAVYPVSPCEVFFEEGGAAAGPRDPRGHAHLALSTADPHTTQTASRTCLDCHGNPKTLGLGEGILYRAEGAWHFRPTWDAGASGLGRDHPLDGWLLRSEGSPEAFDTAFSRPFDAQEVRRILAVSPCLGCHETYEDPVYRDFTLSLERLGMEETLPCARLVAKGAP